MVSRFTQKSSGSFPPIAHIAICRPIDSFGAMHRAIVEIAACAVAILFAVFVAPLASRDASVSDWIAVIGGIAVWEGYPLHPLRPVALRLTYCVRFPPVHRASRFGPLPTHC